MASECKCRVDVELIGAVAWDEGGRLKLLCCNLSKAFDCVDHEILLEQLYYYGVREKAHKLVRGYLQNREQPVLQRQVKIVNLERWNGRVCPG